MSHSSHAEASALNSSGSFGVFRLRRNGRGRQRFRKPRKCSGIEISAVGGFPDLAGLHMGYRGPSFLGTWELGVGFGELPVDHAINARVPLQNLSVSTSSGSYTLIPHATYGLSGLQIFARLNPGDGGFFIQTSYSNLSAGGDFSGDLRNDASGGTLPGVMTGTIRINQPMLNVTVGYEIALGDRFFVDGGLGVGFLLGTHQTTQLGGTVAEFAPLDPQAQASFDQAKSDISAQVDAGVKKFHDAAPVLPAVFLGLGMTLGL